MDLGICNYNDPIKIRFYGKKAIMKEIKYL